MFEPSNPSDLPAEFPFSDPREAPGYLMWQAGMAFQRHLNGVLTSHRLTHTQFILLAGLRWLEATGQTPVSNADLGRFAAVDRMMAAQVIRRLTAFGYIGTSTFPGNLRAQALNITEEGRLAFVNALQDVRTADEKFFAAASPSLPDNLQKLIDGLEP